MDITDRRIDPPPAAGKLRFVNDEGNARILDSNGRRARVRVEAGTPVHATAAAVTIDPTGVDNSITYTAKVAGSAGRNISVTVLISGGGSAATVTVSERSILINVGTATTAQTVITAVNAHAEASALVTASAAGAVTGTFGSSVGQTYLTGGVDATEGQAGDMLVNGTHIFIATAEVAKTSTSGWRKVAHSAL